MTCVERKNVEALLALLPLNRLLHRAHRAHPLHHSLVPDEEPFLFTVSLEVAKLPLVGVHSAAVAEEDMIHLDGGVARAPRHRCELDQTPQLRHAQLFVN